MNDTKREPVLIDLALQGGGSHGAFTWGVLDRLLEVPWLRLDGISGTSAGAMNAVVLAHGLVEGFRGGDVWVARQSGKQALEKFWRRVSNAALMSPFQRTPLDILSGRWSLDGSPVFLASDIAARMFSPYDYTLQGANPLRAMLEESVDFERLNEAPIKLFVTATNVRTGRGRIFRNGELSADVLLASACLPTMFQAVEIDGEAYWDGGYSGNPTITPLVRDCDSADTILVQINPIERPGTPRTAAEIQSRLNEVSFNSPLLKELRMAALLRRVADPGTGEGAQVGEDAHAPHLERGHDQPERLVEDARRMGLPLHAARRGRRAAETFLERHGDDVGVRSSYDIDELIDAASDAMGLLGILLGLGLLVWLSYRGWSVLVLAPVGALIAAGAAREPLLAHWTQTFMGSAAGFLASFFPLFLLGAVFGKLMEDSGSVAAIARWMTERLGPTRAVLAVVLAGALVTYGGVSLFVAFFVIGPMGQALFKAANVPNRLLPAAIALGTSTFTMSALPGTPAIQNAIPMPFFGTTPFAAPGLGIIAAAVMLAFGLWWLARRESAARRAGEGFGVATVAAEQAADDPLVRERASTASTFDPPEARHGRPGGAQPGILVAMLPLAVVVLVNLTMSMVVLPRLDTSFLAEAQWGGISLASVGGVWSVIVALAAAIVVLVALNLQRLPALKATVDAGANASVLPVLAVASLVGFGAVVAAMPAFAVVRDWVVSIEGGPLVSLAIATNILAALTGSASGGLTIALDALGGTYMQIAAEQGIDPALLHRVAVIGAGTLDSLPHNGAVVTLLAVCGSTHGKSYFDIVMVGIVGAMLGLAAVIVLGSMFGSF